MALRDGAAAAADDSALGAIDEPRDAQARLQLLVGLSATWLDAAGAAAVSARLAGGVDWEGLVGLAEAHAVTPLVCANLCLPEVAGVPDEIRAAARVYLEHNRTRNRDHAAELVRILARLRDRGIPAIPFKGPFLAETVYGDLGLRRFRDLDFLIPEPRISATVAVLRDLDYDVSRGLSPRQERAFRRYAGQYIFFASDGRIAVEPHWNFGPRTLAVPIDYDALWSRARPTPFAGQEVLNWDAEDQLLVLCLHGSKERWARLQWIRDVAELIRARPELDWDVVRHRARAQGCLRMVHLGVLLAGDVVGVRLPSTVTAEARSDRTAVALGRQIQGRLGAEPKQTRSIYRLSAYHVRLRERARDKAAYLYRTVTTPRESHFGVVALPDRLFFAYTPLKLAHDYVALPLWLCGKAVARRVTAGRGSIRPPRRDPRPGSGNSPWS